MKKLIVLILTFITLLTFYSLTMAQVYPIDDEFSSASYPLTVWNHSSDWHTVDTWHTTDTWYSVTPEAPYAEIYYNDHNNKNLSNPKLGVEGYGNEQTFFDVQTKPESSEVNYFAGSYLFENGIFLGGSYNGDSKDNISYISPGFRLGAEDASFITLSCDYLTSNENPKPTDNNEIVGYDLYYKYFVGDKAKLGGEAYFPKGENTYWWLGFNIKTADDLVIGAYYETQEDINYYHGGFTFAPSPLIIDVEIGKTYYADNNITLTDENYYVISGMLMTSDAFRFGADYFKYNDLDNGAVHAKVNFGDKKNNFILKYQFKNDTYPSVITAAFKVNFGK